MANEEPQSHKTTTTATAAAVSSTVPPSNGTIRTLLSPKDTVSSSLPTKTPKPVAPAVAIGGQPTPSTSQQQAPKPQSANVVQNLIQQSQKPIAVQQQQQQAQSPTERVGTQVAYDVKQLMSMIQQLPA
ncbi:MAG: hypothetical protein MJE68_02790, partial [Proteobacteria bacterium]|nr:hypothetical protein [Pseudomonadota bacterium]